MFSEPFVFSEKNSDKASRMRSHFALKCASLLFSKQIFYQNELSFFIFYAST